MIDHSLCLVLGLLVGLIVFVLGFEAGIRYRRAPLGGYRKDSTDRLQLPVTRPTRGKR